MTGPLIRILLSYLVGSIVGSLVVGRFHGGVDIRTMGSGNAGGTNALRTQGKVFALWVMVIDIGKGWLAAYGLARWSLPGVGSGPLAFEPWVAAACAAASIVGHVFPVWHGFRGGKGVATLIGAVLGLGPALLAPMLLTWLLSVVLLGFVGLASILAAASLPIYVVLSGAEPAPPLLAFGSFAALLILFTHRANIARMRTGCEPRARRLWLFGRHAQ